MAEPVNGRRVLLIGLNYAPEQVGIGPYSHGLAEALAAQGARVSVIAGKPYYPQWRIDANYAQGGWRHTNEGGIQVTRCPHYVPTDPGGLERIIHLASFALSALPAALRAALGPRDERPQLVIAIAPALLSVITAWIAARLSGARLWIHIQDFEVEAAVATGLLHPGSLAARLGGWVERRLITLADRISTISPQMCARLAEKGVARDRIFEMRNWSDTRFAVDPAGASLLRAEWRLGDRTVALYSGNIARKQGIELLVDAARLLQHRKDIVFVICGEGPNRIALEHRASGLGNVQIHDLQPASRMGALLAAADVHLLPQIAGAADLVLPSKLTNMLASGRPVVATSNPGTGLHDEVDGCGVLTPPGDAAALAKAVTKLADDASLRSLLGQAAQARAVERWQKDAIIARAVVAVTA